MSAISSIQGIPTRRRFYASAAIIIGSLAMSAVHFGQAAPAAATEAVEACELRLGWNIKSIEPGIALTPELLNAAEGWLPVAAMATPSAGFSRTTISIFCPAREKWCASWAITRKAESPPNLGIPHTPPPSTGSGLYLGKGNDYNNTQYETQTAS